MAEETTKPKLNLTTTVIKNHHSFYESAITIFLPRVRFYDRPMVQGPRMTHKSQLFKDLLEQEALRKGKGEFL